MFDWTVIITIVNEARQYLFTPPAYSFKALLGTQGAMTRCGAYDPKMLPV